MSLCGPFGPTIVHIPDREPAPDGTEVWVLGPAVDPDGIAELCERLTQRVQARRVQGGRVTRLVCDVGAITEPDAAVLAALTRMQLTARRLNCRMEIHRMRPRLGDLIAYAGLDEVLPVHRGCGVEPVRQAEQREQPGGVEEVADPPDPAG